MCRWNESRLWGKSSGWWVETLVFSSFLQIDQWHAVLETHYLLILLLFAISSLFLQGICIWLIFFSMMQPRMIFQCCRMGITSVHWGLLLGGMSILSQVCTWANLPTTYWDICVVANVRKFCNMLEHNMFSRPTCSTCFSSSYRPTSNLWTWCWDCFGTSENNSPTCRNACGLHTGPGFHSVVYYCLSQKEKLVFPLKWLIPSRRLVTGTSYERECCHLAA